MLSSISARLITALCGFLVVLAVSSPANASKYVYKDALFCQFVSQYTDEPLIIQSLWKYNRLYAEAENIREFDLNALMISQSQRAVFVIRGVMRNTNTSSVEAAVTVFKASGCIELVRELEGFRDS